MRKILGDMLLAGVEEVRHQHARFFKAKNVLILGPKAAGKTSLLWFLESGKPYRVDGDRRKSPNPTGMAAVVDKKVSLQKKNWLRVQKDLGGDTSLRPQWVTAINELQPEGIIYLIDGRKDTLEQLDGLFEDVFGAIDETATDTLQVLHVFVNFVDTWGGDARIIRKKLREVEDLLFVEMEELGYGELYMDAHATQLSPHKRDWPETEAALHGFSTALGRVN